MTGFHHGILKLAMEPSLLGTALMEGGPDRKIKLDRSPAVDEVISGYTSLVTVLAVIILEELPFSLVPILEILAWKLSGHLISMF